MWRRAKISLVFTFLVLTTMWFVPVPAYKPHYDQQCYSCWPGGPPGGWQEDILAVYGFPLHFREETHVLYGGSPQKVKTENFIQSILVDAVLVFISGVILAWLAEVIIKRSTSS